MKLSKSRDALYTSIAANCFGILAIGAQSFARSVVKRDPSTQSFHLIGFSFIWLISVLLCIVFTLIAWYKYRDIPLEEKDSYLLIRRMAHLFILFSLGLLVLEAANVILSLLLN